MKKRVLTLIAVLAVAVNLAACSGSDESEDPIPPFPPVPQPVVTKLEWTEAACGQNGGTWLNGECWWLGDATRGLVIGGTDETIKSEQAYISRIEHGDQRTKKAYLVVSYLATRPHAEYKDMRLPLIMFSVPLEMEGGDSGRLAKRYPSNDINFDLGGGIGMAGVRVETSVHASEGSATLENTEAVFNGIASGSACYSESLEEALKNKAVGNFNGEMDFSGELKVKVYSTASPEAALSLTEFSVPVKFGRKFDMKVLPSAYGMCLCGGGTC